MKRLPAFDIAKGIGLLAVIIGHCSFAGMPASVVDFCYSFHMPLFFIVSGYFYNLPKKIDLGFVKNLAKHLLLPYAITCIFIIILSGIFTFLRKGDVLSTSITWIIASIYGAGGVHPGMPAGVIGIGAIWYLWALFWGKLLFAEANQLPCPFIVSLALFVVGISTTGIVWLPLGMQNSLCSVLFLYIGKYIKQHNILDSISPLLMVCALATWLYCGLFFGQLYMESNSFQHGVMDVIGSVCGTLCIIKGSEQLTKLLPALVKPLEKLGTITLPLFCMHLVVLNLTPWEKVLRLGLSLGSPSPVTALLVNFLGITMLVLALRFIMPPQIRHSFFSRAAKSHIDRQA